MNRMLRATRLTIVALASGCAATAGTRPEDMSAGQHHAAAETLERSAEIHAHRSDPGGGTICGGAAQGSSPCWSTVSNQREHEREAARLHELAERHRAAGHALVQAELDACSGTTGGERDLSPFFHRADVAAVAELGGAPGEEQRTGARIRFRPVAHLTADWLGQAVRCHLARAAALGYPEELAYCPLAVRGANAKISARADGLEVEVWGTDPGVGAEIVRRARALAASSGAHRSAAP